MEFVNSALEKIKIKSTRRIANGEMSRVTVKTYTISVEKGLVYWYTGSVQYAPKLRVTRQDWAMLLVGEKKEQKRYKASCNIRAFIAYSLRSGVVNISGFVRWSRDVKIYSISSSVESVRPRHTHTNCDEKFARCSARQQEPEPGQRKKLHTHLFGLCRGTNSPVSNFRQGTKWRAESSL